MRLEFSKYEGLGNDFVVIDAERPDLLRGDQVERLCDRHFGIGADGVLLVLPPATGAARARMAVVNADGSRPEMCGNGLRCVALHLARRDGANGISYVVDTDAGPLACEVTRDGDSALVGVDMGRGVLQGTHVTEHDGRRIELARVSMGNPHAIVFEQSFDLSAIDRLGAQVSGELAGGSNVEFARQTSERRFELVVWERGVGRTLACGTGAAATAVAAASSGRAPFGVPLEIRLPGGPLEITVEQATLGVSLRGPARLVFTGEVSA